MAREKSIDLRARAKQVMPPTEVRALARACGLIEREREFDAAAFASTLAFGPRNTGIDGLRRAYELATRSSIARSTFYDKFTPESVAFTSELAARVVQRTARCPALDQGFQSLAAVLAIDSTVIRLCELLRDQFPGSRTNHSKAAVKLHTVMNATAWNMSVKITSGKTADVRALKIGRWTRGKLLLMDCAYFSYDLLERIRLTGGYFVVRLPAHVNPTVKSVLRGPTGVDDVRFRDVVNEFDGPVLDVDGLAKYRHNKGRRRVGARKSGVFRFVGVRDPESGELWTYATNLPSSFSAEAVASVYRARWIVELLFKSLKNDFDLDQLRSSNPNVVQTLIYATVVGWAISNELRQAFAENSPVARRVTPQRWARVTREVGPLLVAILARPNSHLAGSLAQIVEALLRFEAHDPHLARASTIERALKGGAVEAPELPLSTRRGARRKGA